MKDDIISILSCNQFLTEKEIQKFLPSVSSKKEIQEILLQLQSEDKVAKYNFSNRNYWISARGVHPSSLGTQVQKYLSNRKIAQKLHLARTCYHHLGGKLAVQIFTNFYNSNKISLTNFTNCKLTDSGIKFISSVLPKTNSQKVKIDVDFSEQKPHIAGVLGKIS
ncbi:hypothetical protein A3O17_03445 [Ligilactobacillus aviarius]|uniref:hypothetical protein n=1 Tax=Ligilactobacillus aviarius TaxID=1606 RepID=UPI0007D9A99D|nr:hypothetical protein [Ligilactobacillus aviarius]OAQ08422.1 hypothetical protein A3O15_04460 [Ligilactobacillus aviarius]OAS76953.1 hypothetical protein A3O17_03445 [Ligilactobacillus aviarius]